MMIRNIALLLLTCILLPALSPFPAQAAAPRPEGIPETYQRVAENETFRLYINPETLAFKVLDKRNEYVWSSNLDEKIEGDRLNRTWTAFAQSGFSIDYLDQRANPSRASITNAEHTTEIQPIENGLQAQVTFPAANISVGIRIQLEPSGVRVEVPFESIQETGEYRLGLLHLYPWMGATRGGERDGYMFLPDGCGSLIYFTEQTQARNMYYGRYYGADVGMSGSLPFHPASRPPYTISLPVIGMVHGEGRNAYLAILEQGAPYAEIQAHPAGIITNFNFLYNAFTYNQSYFQRTSRSGDGVTVLQPRTNRYDIILHYRFLSGAEANYVGMARSYQQYLIEKGMLHKAATGSASGIGIRLEFLAAEQEKILFWKRTIPMTTIEQVGAILERLNVANPQVVYYGWQPGGASSMPPQRLKLDAKLGSLSDLQALSEAVAARGGSLNLYFDPLAAFAYERNAFSRYDLALAITNEYSQGYHRGKPHYYFNLPAIEANLSSLSQDINRRLPLGLALDSLGGTLYSDFRRGQTVNRQEAIAALQAMLAENPLPLAFYTPNDYLLGYASAYYDIPLDSSGYTYMDKTVPFLQIALSGYVPYYGEALNFSSDVRGDLLRHAEYGAYPSFFLTYEPTARILDTRSNWIYVSAYEQLQPEIEAGYAWLNALLGSVRGASIVAHEQIAAEVFATTYDNGRQIIVNYSQRPVTVYGLTVPARDAIAREVTP